VDGNIDDTNRFLRSKNVALDWQPGDYLILRWFNNDNSGNDLGLGIDDLSFTAAVPEPASLGMLGLGVTMLFRRRSCRPA
jgi:hypothetical protein